MWLRFKSHMSRKKILIPLCDKELADLLYLHGLSCIFSSCLKEICYGIPMVHTFFKLLETHLAKKIYLRGYQEQAFLCEWDMHHEKMINNFLSCFSLCGVVRPWASTIWIFFFLEDFILILYIANVNAILWNQWFRTPITPTVVPRQRAGTHHLVYKPCNLAP